MIELRGHHLFCTFLFSGSGYDESFTENMKKTIDSLRQGEPFQICRGHDAICACCPNRLPDGCALGTEDVARRDAAALRELNISPGDELTWERLRARQAGIGAEAFQRVCGACRWQREGLCSFALLSRRAKAKP